MTTPWNLIKFCNAKIIAKKRKMKKQKHEVDKERRMDDTKLPWHMDRVKERFDKGKRVPPIHIDWGLTKFCNVKCIFCYGQYQEMSKDLIKRDALLNAVKEAGEAGVRSVAFIGDGEPTCNPAFYDALRIGKESGLDLSTSTNGALLTTPEKRGAILDNCEWMRFCLSAGTREGYKQIHGVDKFDQVKKNIEAIVKERDNSGSKCDIGLQSVFVPTLMGKEMVEEAKLAVDLGVDYFVIKQCSLPDDGASGMMMFDLNDYDKPEVLDSLSYAEALSTERTKIIPKWGMIAQKGARPYEGCKSIPLISEISGNGDWYPCGYMFGEHSKFKEDFRFGNLHEKGFREILESDRYWSIIDKMHDFDVQKDCKGCCRQDKTNEFCDKYEKGKLPDVDTTYMPKGVNFI